MSDRKLPNSRQPIVLMVEPGSVSLEAAMLPLPKELSAMRRTANWGAKKHAALPDYDSPCQSNSHGENAS